MVNIAKNKSLKDVCEIIRGYHFRQGLSHLLEGSVSVISPSNILENGGIDWARLAKVSCEKLDQKLVLKEGDILFPARGIKTSPILVSFKKSFVSTSQVVASDLFYILRIKDKDVTPNYLTWYFEQPIAKKYIESNAIQGSQIQMVSLKDFSELKISLPSLEKQKLIANIADLANLEEELSHKIISNRKKIIKQLLLSSVAH